MPHALLATGINTKNDVRWRGRGSGPKADTDLKIPDELVGWGSWAEHCWRAKPGTANGAPTGAAHKGAMIKPSLWHC